VQPFTYSRAGARLDAVSAAGPETMFLAGGTELVQLLKAGLATPRQLIDIGHLDEGRGIDLLSDKRVHIPALATMAATARNPLVCDRWPMVADALLLSASQQIRNVATIGGNLLQRTRCSYFRDVTMPCNKHAPGTGCPAREGEHRHHAIFGTSEHCIASHPSDLAVALMALDAVVEVEGASGRKRIPISDLYLQPGNQPERDHSLAAGDLIVAVDLPAGYIPRHRQRYLKIRDRQSFEFAIVSLACALDLAEDGTIRGARMAAGGVGTIPWRFPAVEALLINRRGSPALFAEAGELAVDGAQPLSGNRFKVQLLRNLLVRMLEDLAGATA
jgi:xanthine dehydrogenase YagS FAD-binding subunit